MSLLAKSQRVNGNAAPKDARAGTGLVLAEKLFKILHKADQDYHGGSRHTGKEQYFKKAEQEDYDRHAWIICANSSRKCKGEIGNQ